jgi:membrane-associated phospholipid phosphatase
MSNRSLECRRQLIIPVFILIVVSAGAGFAQEPASEQPGASPVPSPTPSLEHRFLKNILQDQIAIWTAPFSVQKSDAKWIAPLTLSSAVLFATDRHSAGELAEPGDHQTRLRISSDISRGGALYTTTAVAGTFYLIGRFDKNARARETGLLSAEALIDAGIVTSALKTASQRPRPSIDDASGEFFDKGNSFPSGHAASAWSVATVIAHEYGRHRPLVSLGAYGLATAISISRYTGQKHFLSDSLVGSAIGFGVGRYVYKTHHDKLLDGSSAKTNSISRSKLVPDAYPIYSRIERTYGLALAWHL